MSATKILWGQVLTVFAIVLVTTWTATEWTAWRGRSAFPNRTFRQDHPWPHRRHALSNRTPLSSRRICALVQMSAAAKLGRACMARQ